MPSGRYLVAINGFAVTNETWDDVFGLDGRRDEVFLSTSVVAKNRNGDTIYQSQPRSPTIGDTNNQNGRVQGGSDSALGGLRTGDVFPYSSPWLRQIPLSPARNWPPCAVWEGDLTGGENAVFISPTIWEWDPGQSMLEGWVNWHRRIDQEFGARAREIVTGVFPVAGPIFDAVSLGIQTAATLSDAGPIGSQRNRPIGFRRNPDNANQFDFNPWVLTLTYETAEQIVSAQPAGLGPGLLALRYEEDPYFRGDYTLYVQVEKLEFPPFDGRVMIGPLTLPPAGVRR